MRVFGDGAVTRSVHVAGAIPPDDPGAQRVHSRQVSWRGSARKRAAPRAAHGGAESFTLFFTDHH